MDGVTLIKERLTVDDIITLLERFGFERISVHYGQIRACCAIHGGDNPNSFCYSTTKHVYFCQKCHETGDIITLVEEMLNIGFVESVRYLLHYLNIEDIESISIKQRPNHFRRDLENFKNYSHQAQDIAEFIPPTMNGKQVLQFRHFSENTLRYFGFKYYEDIPFTKLDGEQTVFKKRLGVPIYFKETLVGISYRATNSSSIKWLHTPTGLEKNKILYNFIANKWYEEIILTEGMFDTWAFHEAGLTDVVAILGSSIASGQLSLLTRNAYSVVLCFDNDEAGNKCTKQAIHLLKDKFEVSVVVLPEGKDPCDVSSDTLHTCYLQKISWKEWLKHYERRI